MTILTLAKILHLHPKKPMKLIACIWMNHEKKTLNDRDGIEP
jgi:hypothetical protein